MSKKKQKHTIVVNESDISKIVKIIEMTEQKFHENMRYFISQLLQDPVNAAVPPLFAQRGFTRSNLLNHLLGGKDPILFRDQKISDKDENGEPKTATMIVKFRCPKKNFERKLEKLYIKLFEKNLPPRHKKHKEKDLNEEGGGATGCCGAIDGMGGEGANGGAFIAPLYKGNKSDVIRRQMPTEIGESTTTFNTGNYEYPAPAFDKEKGKNFLKPALERHDGKNGSVSIPKRKKS